MAKLNDFTITISAEDKSSAGMNSASKGLDNFSRQMGALQGQLNQFEKGTASLIDQLGKLVIAGLGILAVREAYEEFKLIISESITAAIEQENSERKLAQAIGFTSQALLDQATALQLTTNFSDDQIITAQSLIGAFTHDEQQIKKLTIATLDLAAAKSMDLASAADVIAKSFGLSTNALKRYGIEVEGAAGSTERLTMLASGIERLYGGQAAAQAETFGGKLEQIRHAYDETLESIGNIIVKNQFFIKVLDDTKAAFVVLEEWIKRNQDSLRDIAKNGFVTVIEAAGLLLAGLRELVIMWDILKLGANTAVTAMFTALELLLKIGDFLGSPSKSIDKFFGIEEGKESPGQKLLNTMTALKETAAATNQQILSDMNKTSQKYNELIAAVREWANSLKAIPTSTPSTRAPSQKGGATVSEESLIPPGAQALNDSIIKQTADLELQIIKLTQGEEAYLNAIERRMIAQGGNIANVEKLIGLMKELSDAQKDMSLAEKAAAADQSAMKRRMESAKIEADYKKALDEEELQRKKDLETKKTTVQQVAMQATVDLLNALYIFSGEKSKALFNLWKAASIAQAIVNTYEGASKAIAQGGIYGPILAAGVIAAGMVQVARIQATQIGDTSASGESSTLSVGSSSSTDLTSTDTSSSSDTPQPITNNIYIYGNLVDMDELSRTLMKNEIYLEADKI